MPVVVACQCGQRFEAEDRLIGQQLPCPVCGRILAIGSKSGAGPAPHAAPPPAEGIYVACTCGGAFLAPPRLSGKSVKCPNCGGQIQVPSKSVHPLGPQSPAVTFGVDPLTQYPTALATSLPTDWLAGVFQRLAVFAVVLLIVAIVVTALVNWIFRAEVQPKASSASEANTSSLAITKPSNLLTAQAALTLPTWQV